MAIVWYDEDMEPLKEETPSIWNGDTWAEDETTSVIIPPTVSGSSSMWKVFSANELERMEELFVEMIQKSSPVSKVCIKETLEKIDWGVESFVGHGYQPDKVWKASTKGFQVMNV